MWNIFSVCLSRSAESATEAVSLAPHSDSHRLKIKLWRIKNQLMINVKCFYQHRHPQPQTPPLINSRPVIVLYLILLKKKGWRHENFSHEAFLNPLYSSTELATWDDSRKTRRWILIALDQQTRIRRALSTLPLSRGCFLILFSLTGSLLQRREWSGEYLENCLVYLCCTFVRTIL